MEMKYEKKPTTEISIRATNLWEEIRKAVRNMKGRKAEGSDEVVIEMVEAAWCKSFSFWNIV